MSTNKQILDNVIASMAMEDMPLETEEEILIMDCLEGKVNFDDAIGDIINQYKCKQVG